MTTLLLVVAGPAAGEDAVGKRGSAPFTRLNNLSFAIVDGEKIALDLYLSKKSQKPRLIIWIHGGGWTVGDEQKCRICWLAFRGYAVASINYRLLKTAIYPAQIHDVKAAVRWLRANQEKYGCDATRIGVAGASAGGHLAALLATASDVEELEGAVGSHLDESSRVHAVVSISGFSDLETSFASNPDARIKTLLGGTPTEQPEQSNRASPVHFVGPGDAPLLLVHGENDPIVDPGQARQLHRAYQDAELESTLVMIPGRAHLDLELTDPRVRIPVAQFFATHLASPRP